MGKSRFARRKQHSRAGGSGIWQRRGDGGGRGPVPSPSPSSLGLTGAPGAGAAGGLAGPRPPSMAQEAAPFLLVVLARLVSSTWHEGECWGAWAQRGSLGTAAWRGACGREGGVPWDGHAGECIGARGVWGACRGALRGTRRSRGGAGRHPARSRKPASPSHPCLRGCSFPADSLLPRGPSAGSCLPGLSAQNQPSLQPSS